MNKKFNINKHKTILTRILRDIYSDKELRSVLGFKGGTAAMLFYGLDRASVDIDLNLLDETKEELVNEKIPNILKKYGKMLEATIKRFTLFFLLDYGFGEKKVKVEISRRKSLSQFRPMNYLGVTMLVMIPEDTLAHKLSALLTRKVLASRDMYDLNFFMKKDWKLNPDVVKEQTGFTVKEALKKAILKVKNVQNNRVLNGLGELIPDNQKNSVRDTLREELVFNLKLYLSQIK